MKNNYTVRYLPGKQNILTDYLSCNPGWSSSQSMVQNAYRIVSPVKAIIRTVKTKVYRRQLKDLLLQEIKDVALADENYQLVLSHVKDKTLFMVLRMMPQDNPIQSYLAVFKILGILNDSICSPMTLNT